MPRLLCLLAERQSSSRVARNLEVVDIPLTGGGEQSAAAPGAHATGEAWRLENGMIIGKAAGYMWGTGPHSGIVAQTPDWKLAATATEGTGTPPAGGFQEVYGIIGIFPFAQIGNIGGGQSSGAIAFGLTSRVQKVFLFHLDENGAIMRAIDTSTGMGLWTLLNPPQVTGFEMNGKFYFNFDGREAGGSRKGMGFYDPQAGSITFPTFNLNGGGANVLQFKGIALHQGGTILGWGYRDKNNPNTPEQILYNKYVDPSTWVPAATDGDISAGGFQVGTIGVPIIGCAQSAQYTIIGKEREIFVLDGNFQAQFSVRPIGNAHGPISPCGIQSIGWAAVWMSEDGPAMSENGGNVKQLGVDKILRRFLTYFDLTYTASVHNSINNRVGWLLKRAYTFDGVPLSNAWGDEILWWDYARDLFYVERTPEVCYSIGIIKGTGQTVTGPVGNPTNLAASAVATQSAQITWTNGDSSNGVTTLLEYRVNGASAYITANSGIGAGFAGYLLTGLTTATIYDVRVTHYKNGIASSALVGLSLFTTSINPPSNLQASGVTGTTATVSWTNGLTANYQTEVDYKATTDANWTVAQNSLGTGVTGTTLTNLAAGKTYQVRVKHITSGGVSSPYAENDALFTTPGAALAVPTLNAASGITATTFHVNWTNADPTKQTLVQYKRSADATWLTWATELAGTNTDLITGLVASTAYDVQIAHVDSGTGNVGQFATTTGYATTTGATPAAPTLNAASAITASGFTVNWTNHTAGVTYTLQVEYRQNGQPNWTVGATGIANGVTSQVLSGLSGSTAYDVRIKATDAGIDSSYATTANYATTTSAGGGGITVGTPTSLATKELAGYPIGHQDKWTLTWNRVEFSAGSKTEVWENAAHATGGTRLTSAFDSSVTSFNLTKTVPNGGLSLSYSVRHVLANGTVGAFSNIVDIAYNYQGPQ